MAPSLTRTALLFFFSICATASQRAPCDGADSSQSACASLNHAPPPSPPPLETSSPGLASDYELRDIVLVASVDGQFHALNRTSGETLWSMSAFAAATGGSAPASLAPLVRTTHLERDLDLVDDPDAAEGGGVEMYVIEPQSGDVYVLTSPGGALQKFPFSMAELVDMSPFISVGEKGAEVFVGRKEMSLWVIELETGRVRAAVDAECPFIRLGGLDGFGGGRGRVCRGAEVYIGRIDYHVSIHKRAPPGKPAPAVQELRFSTYAAHHEDAARLQAGYRRTRDDVYLQARRDGGVVAFRAREGKADSALCYCGAEDGRFIWGGGSLLGMIVAVFDVLQAPPHASSSGRRASGFVLLQPRPELSALFPGTTAAACAYVGVVEVTGSLYALSAERFPLVVFGAGGGGALHAAPKEKKKPNTVNDDGGQGAGGEAEEAQCVRKRYAVRCLVGVRAVAEADGAALAVGRVKYLLDG